MEVLLLTVIIVGIVGFSSSTVIYLLHKKEFDTYEDVDDI